MHFLFIFLFGLYWYLAWAVLYTIITHTIQVCIKLKCWIHKNKFPPLQPNFRCKTVVLKISNYPSIKPPFASSFDRAKVQPEHNQQSPFPCSLRKEEHLSQRVANDQFLFLQIPFASFTLSISPFHSSLCRLLPLLLVMVLGRDRKDVILCNRHIKSRNGILKQNILHDFLGLSYYVLGAEGRNLWGDRFHWTHRLG